MIRNIWAVGRNFSDHAKELGNDLPPEPMIFLKAGSCATFAEKEISLPPWTQDIHHELELALKFDSHLQISEACLALDLTARSVQNALKAKGHPWTLAKSFQGACPLTPFFPVENLQNLEAAEFSLMVNGQIRQKGSPSQMIFGSEKLIQFVKMHFPVVPGDLLLTGTPAGVAALSPGDIVEAELVGKIKHTWTVR